MIKKTFLLILIVFGLSSCGYTPMLSQNNNFNFNIVNLELLGDKNINNFLEKKLKQYSNDSSNKSYKISINSNYQKIIVAKDSTGNATDLKLISTIDVTYSLYNESNNQERKISFLESITIRKNNNAFDQKNYERSVLNNLSQLLLNKLVFYLSKEE
tara:strand:- start:173 stop:643 length:471 start_codon:yes stop_codon:yes gene_type:complete